MRFLFLIQANAAVAPLDAAIRRFHGVLTHAGVLLDAAMLPPATAPFSAPVTAYLVIQARDLAEAEAWAQRFPAAVPGGGIEVLPLQGIDPPVTRTA